MELILLGLSHKTAPVEVRECFAPLSEHMPSLLREILALPGVHEAFLLSTCNRLEVLIAADHGQAREELRYWFIQRRSLNSIKIDNLLYQYQNKEAVYHLFRVASSLDSLILGEPQILGQMKEAYRLAVQVGSTSIVLNRLLHKSFQVAKKVRSRTAIGGAAVSVSYATVKLANKIFNDFTDLKILLIGAGKIAELTAKHLLSQGECKLLVANRTLDNAIKLASRIGIKDYINIVYSLDELTYLLSLVDIVISSTGSHRLIITQDMVKFAINQRRNNRSLFFIDIAVPRDVDPKINELDRCYVYNIDDLDQVVQINRANRVIEAEFAESIITEEVDKFIIWLDSLVVLPTISELITKFEAIRQIELTRTFKELGKIDPKHIEILERMTQSIIKKILHNPIIFLRKQIQHNQEVKKLQITLVRRLFQLNNEDNIY